MRRVGPTSRRAFSPARGGLHKSCSKIPCLTAPSCCARHPTLGAVNFHEKHGANRTLRNRTFVRHTRGVSGSKETSAAYPQILGIWGRAVVMSQGLAAGEAVSCVRVREIVRPCRTSSRPSVRLMRCEVRQAHLPQGGLVAGKRTLSGVASFVSAWAAGFLRSWAQDRTIVRTVRRRCVVKSFSDGLSELSVPWIDSLSELSDAVRSVDCDSWSEIVPFAVHTGRTPSQAAPCVGWQDRWSTLSS